MYKLLVTGLWHKSHHTLRQNYLFLSTLDRHQPCLRFINYFPGHKLQWNWNQRRLLLFNKVDLKISFKHVGYNWLIIVRDIVFRAALCILYYQSIFLDLRQLPTLLRHQARFQKRKFQIEQHLFLRVFYVSFFGIWDGFFNIELIKCLSDMICRVCE